MEEYERSSEEMGSSYIGGLIQQLRVNNYVSSSPKLFDPYCHLTIYAIMNCHLFEVLS
jgi:hypothetical protein